MKPTNQLPARTACLPRPAMKRAALVMMAATLVIVLSGLAAGCQDSTPNNETTTSSLAISPSESTVTTATSGSTISTERIVVGGQKAEEYEAALPDLEAAVKAAPDDLNALQKLAVAQYNTGRYEEAAATYQKMLQLKDDAPTRNNYGNVLRDLKKWDEAKVQYEKAISLDPTYAYAYVNLVVILRSQGQADAAMRVLDQGIAATTGDDKTWLETYKQELTAATTTTTT